MDVHSLRVCLRSPFLSDYTRCTVMRLSSSVSCSGGAAAAPPSWLSGLAACSATLGRQAVPVCAARARGAAAQGTLESTCLGRRDGSRSDGLRPGRRHQHNAISNRAGVALDAQVWKCAMILWGEMASIALSCSMCITRPQRKRGGASVPVNEMNR